MDTGDDLKIIPTQYKSRLPHTLSYPVGAEMLSQAFRGIPQFERLIVRFWFWGQSRPDYETRYAVLRVGYSRPAKSVHTRPEDLEGGRTKIKWEITVHPVPRVRRHEIQMELRERALPEARAWLERNANLAGEDGSALTFSFDEENDVISSNEETHLGPVRER